MSHRRVKCCCSIPLLMADGVNVQKKAFRDLSRHWKKKILCGSPLTTLLETRFMGHHPRMQQDTLPQHLSCSSSCNPGVKTKMSSPADLASLTSLIHPRAQHEHCCWSI